MVRILNRKSFGNGSPDENLANYLHSYQTKRMISYLAVAGSTGHLADWISPMFEGDQHSEVPTL
jgi:hypothetical protein